MDPDQDAIVRYLQGGDPQQQNQMGQSGMRPIQSQGEAGMYQPMSGTDPQIDHIANLIQESQQRGFDQMRGPIAPEIMETRRQMMPQGMALDERMAQPRIPIGNPDKWSRTYNR